MFALLKSPENVRIHVNCKVLLSDDLFVSGGDGLVDPVSEGLTYDTIDQVS